MTVELDYNGVYGSDLQAGLLNPNQVPMSVVNDLIARFGPIGDARPAELAASRPPAAVAAGITTAVSELHQSGRAALPDASARRCGPIRNTSR